MFIDLYRQVEIQRNWMLIKLRSETLNEATINERMGKLLDQLSFAEARFTTAMLGDGTKKEKETA